MVSIFWMQKSSLGDTKVGGGGSDAKKNLSKSMANGNEIPRVFYVIRGVNWRYDYDNRK